MNEINDPISLRWLWHVGTDETQRRADLAILHALEQGLGSWTLPAAADRPSLSRSQLQKLIDEERVTADGSPVKAKSRLQPGMQVEIRLSPPRPLELVPENRPLEILFEDEHLLVLNKPPGLTVHPAPTQMEGTLVHALLHHIEDLSGIGGVLRPGIVHRLDKDTSGALVITKTDAAHQAMTEIFSRHDIDRRYWAICYGSPDIRSGKELRIETLIGRSPTDRKKMSANVKSGRRAVSHVRKIEEYGTGKAKPFASLLEVRLETGRTHQVRVHLTTQGHSLLGDPAYGAPSERHTKWLALPEEIRALARNLPGQALHARILGFRHPITGQELRFEADPPAAFLNLLTALKKYS